LGGLEARAGKTKRERGENTGLSDTRQEKRKTKNSTPRRRKRLKEEKRRNGITGGGKNSQKNAVQAERK